MKKFNIRSMNRKTFFLSLVLLIAVVGVGITAALSVARTDPVVNSFEVGKIDTSIEENVEEELQKAVTVKNSSDASSDAFIRVRINAPDERMLKFAEESLKTWEYGEDGFYYYLYSVAPNASTTQLLSKVSLDQLDQSVLEELKQTGFDVTVYQESCIATTERHYEEGVTPLDLTNIKNAFKNATGTVHSAK